MTSFFIVWLLLGVAAWVWNSRDDPSQLPGFLAASMILPVSVWMLSQLLA